MFLFYSTSYLSEQFIRELLPVIRAWTTAFLEAPRLRRLCCVLAMCHFDGTYTPLDPILQRRTCYTALRALYHSPFILVPRGSPFLPIKAQALSSNLTNIPSFLCTSFAHRTTIACLTSPLLTLLSAAAALEGPPSSERVFWMTTIMRSPCAGQYCIGELHHSIST